MDNSNTRESDLNKRQSARYRRGKKSMDRIPSVYSMVKLSTKDRSYTTDIGKAHNNVRMWSCKDVVYWLTNNYFDKAVIKNFKRSKIDGAALLSLNLDRLATEFGVTRIGQQKRLMMLIWSNTADCNNHNKSKSNTDILTSAHIITVLYHKNSNHNEGTVLRLFFSTVPTYRDFIQHLDNQLSAIQPKSIFYYDEQSNLIYVNNSESWYNYMDIRERDPSIMLEVQPLLHNYILLDMMDCYALVTDTDSTVIYCNTKLKSVITDSTNLKYSDVICTESSSILGSNTVITFSNIQTIPTNMIHNNTVYIHIIT